MKQRTAEAALQHMKIDHSRHLADAIVIYCGPGSFALDGCADGHGYLEHLLEVWLNNTCSTHFGFNYTWQMLFACMDPVQTHHM